MTQTAPEKRKLCERIKWRVVPFFLFFFVVVAVLFSVYRFRTDPAELSSNSGASSRHPAKARHPAKSGTFYEEGRTNDRWLVVSDDQDGQFLCSLVDVATDLHWRTVVIGNNVTCCRKHCVLLDDAKVRTLKYDVLGAMANSSSTPDGHRVTRRNVAYLYAMQHGARHIFDAYPDTYSSAQVPLETFKQEMHSQLQNLAMNVALGIVSERPYVKRVQNPYAHFGRPHLWTEGFRQTNQRYMPNHVYRICEVRPPSIEKFLDTDGGFFDWEAPALTLPGSTVAPFSSKNTLYSIEAFWGLILLPNHQPSIPAHLLRSLWNQAVLGDIAGSMKLSLSKTSTLQRRKKNEKDPSELREPDGLASFLLKWTCSTRSSLTCARELFKSMHQFHYISTDGLAFFESWIHDLRRSHYLEPPVIPRRRGSMNPCIGADGLYGVTFYPALAPHQQTAEQVGRISTVMQHYSQKALELVYVSESNAGVAIEDVIISNQEPRSVKTSSSSSHFPSEENPMPLIREFTDNACPGYAELLPHVAEQPVKNLLLIVAMQAMRYEMIPMFEAIYREHFRNILYCGGPHESIEIFLRKYQTSERRSFSFLPIHSKYTYECLLGALEMGYNVDGWIMTTDDALINSWNVPRANTTSVWYSGDHNVSVNESNWSALDPGNQKLPRSIGGVHKVLEFLKNALIGYDPVDELLARAKRGAEIKDDSLSDKILLDKLSPDLLPPSSSETSERSKGHHVFHDLKHGITEQRLNFRGDGENDKQIVDLVELKSIGDGAPTNVDDEPDSLKYQVSAEIRDTQRKQSEESLPSVERPSNESSSPVVIVAFDEPTNSTGDGEWRFDPEDETVLIDEEFIVETEDEPEDDGEPKELPVAEVLHKLLVATRNSTNNSSTDGKEDEDQHPPHDATVDLTIHDVAGDEERVHSHRDNPAIDLFLHPPANPETNVNASSHSIENDGTALNRTEVVQEANVPAPGVPDVADETVKTDATSKSEEPIKDNDEDKKTETDVSHAVDETLAQLKDLYALIKGNLRSLIDGPDVNSKGDASFYGGDRGYRVDPKSLHQFRCEEGTNVEFCRVSLEFLNQLVDNNGDEFQLVYDQVPLYYIPKKDQLKFYLLSNLMLQHGVTDEIAVPLILAGLSAEREWVKLTKSTFSVSKSLPGDGMASFNGDATVLYPVDLQTITTDPRYNKVFCLKYMLRVLQL